MDENTQQTQQPPKNYALEAKIIEAGVCESTYKNAPKGTFEVYLKFETPEGNEEIWHQEFSAKKSQVSFYAGRTQASIAVEQLQTIGWEGGMNVYDMSSLVGKVVPIRIDFTKSKDGDRYYKNVRLGSGGLTINKIGDADAKARVEALIKQLSSDTAPAFAQAAPQQAPASSPFSSPFN